MKALEHFDWFFGGLDNINSELKKCSFNLSHLPEILHSAIKISSEMVFAWRLWDVGRKERLQKLLFPDGIISAREKGIIQLKK